LNTPDFSSVFIDEWLHEQFFEMMMAATAYRRGALFNLLLRESFF